MKESKKHYKKSFKPKKYTILINKLKIQQIIIKKLQYWQIVNNKTKSNKK